MSKAVMVSNPDFPIGVLLCSVFRDRNITRNMFVLHIEWEYVQVKVVKKSEHILLSDFVDF
jgi:hypothetical protein